MSKPKLALIPSGYKSGKVYSILPNDATGDFDFTRQSIGTRVRKDGLIEEAKTSGSITNLQPRSEEFDNSVWIKTRTTITADQELAPNGTNTADKLTGDGTGTSYVYDALNFTASQKYTISIYVKPINVTTFSIQKFSGGFGVAFFDLSTGTISSAPTGTMSNPIIESLPNGWFRCSAEHIPTATGTQNYGFGIQDYNGDQFYIWGAMVSEGALSDYIKTEGATETKRVETFTDVPRLDWLNSNCPSLLLESQRTNAFKYSQDFSNSNWTKTDFTISSNQITAPDGTLTASELFETSATSGKFLHQNTSVATGNDYTVSYFIKYQNKQYIQLTGSTGFSTSYVNFDILNGEIVRNLDNVDARIEDFGNGWYRISLTLEATSTTSGRILLVGIRAATSFRAESYTGDTSNSYYIWGGQMEQGTYPTSYIKTEAGAVTRLKDDCHLLNQTLFTDYPFTVYAKAKVDNFSNVAFSLIDSVASNKYLSIQFTSSSQIGVLRRDASNNDSDYYSFSYSIGDTLKIAISYINNTSYKLYVNGTELADITSGLSIPFDHNDISLGQFRIASDTGTRNSIDDFRVFDYTLTDAELTELTTL